MMNKRKTVLASALFFISGVGAASFLPEGYIVQDFFFFLLFLLFFILSFGFREQRSKAIGLVLIAFLFLGIWRLEFAEQNLREQGLQEYNGQKISFQGLISSEPDIRADNQKLTISAVSHDGKVLVTTDLFPKYVYGDILQIDCTLKKPEKFEDFAYDRFLARYGIASICYYPKIEKIGEQTGFKSLFFKKLFSLKGFLQESINRHLPEPTAGLLNAMLLGYKRGMNNDLRNELSQAGLSHIAAISGLHISILISMFFIGAIYAGLDRRRSFWLTSVLLFLYIALIGFPASAVRAGSMGFLVLLAMYLGRLNRLGHSLVLTALIILLINPLVLRDDIGFQLSFLAVLGIAWFYPWLKARFLFQGVVWELVLVSFSAQVLTLPIIALNFGIISLISPVSNLLVLWILPVILAVSLPVLVVSAVFPAIGSFIFMPVQFMLQYVILVAHFLSFGHLDL